jgi:hypothetical protein
MHYPADYLAATGALVRALGSYVAIGTEPLVQIAREVECERVGARARTVQATREAAARLARRIEVTRERDALRAAVGRARAAHDAADLARGDAVVACRGYELEASEDAEESARERLRIACEALSAHRAQYPDVGDE